MPAASNHMTDIYLEFWFTDSLFFLIFFYFSSTFFFLFVLVEVLRVIDQVVVVFHLFSIFISISLFYLTFMIIYNNGNFHILTFDKKKSKKNRFLVHFQLKIKILKNVNNQIKMASVCLFT